MIVLVMIMVAVVVAPGPVFLLLIFVEFAEVAMSIAMGLDCPPVIVADLIVVPHVIVGVVRIVNPVGMVFSASDPRQGRCQRGRQKQRTQGVRTTNHVVLLRDKETLGTVISC